VWNRQPTEHDLIDPANTGLGHRQVQRWNLPDGWVISARPAHPALVEQPGGLPVPADLFRSHSGLGDPARPHGPQVAL
jgi:hypothetical protein